MQLEQSVLPPTPEHVRVQTPPRYHQNTYTCWEFLYHQIFSFVLCVLCVLSLCRTKPLFISYPLFWLQNNEKDWNKKQVVPGTFTWTRWTSPQPETNPSVWLPRHPQGRVFRVHLAGKPLLCCAFCSTFQYFVSRPHVFLLTHCTHACILTYTHSGILTYTHTHIHTYTYTHTDRHTHTHT